MKELSDILVWRTDIITQNGMHYYGIMHEIFGIGIALTASGWVWITIFAGIIKLECQLFKRQLVISQNKVIFFGIVIFIAYFIVNRFHVYFYGYNNLKLAVNLVLSVFLIPQILVILFTKKRTVLRFPK
jgi:hypothetical protein